MTAEQAWINMRFWLVVAAEWPGWRPFTPDEYALVQRSADRDVFLSVPRLDDADVEDET